MDIPKLSELNCSTCTERSMRLHYPEFYQYLSSKYLELSWSEKLYWHYNGLEDFPRCPVCGNKTRFDGIKRGYREFCSLKCMNSHPNIQERKKQTTLKKYGVEHHMQSKEILEKSKRTVQEKYGVDNVFQSDDIKRKIRNTNIKRYGTVHHLQNSDVKQKLIATMRSKSIDNDNSLIGYTDKGEQIRKCPHKECTKCQEKFYITTSSIHFDRNRIDAEQCTNLLEIGAKHKSTLEYKIRQLLDKLEVKYVTNSRKVLGNRQEVDFFLEDYNLAIECNGIWTHSTMNNKDPKSKSYHMNKYELCEARGITLLNLWEDWINGKWDIVESIILNKLHKCSEKIHARKCIVKEIDTLTCNNFLTSNHIQGKSFEGYHVRLGLYYNERLVSVMTFRMSNSEWQLNRFCNSIGLRVVGGASKLLNYFIKSYNPNIIVSFSCNDISNGNLYKTLGFDQTRKNEYVYWYYTPGSLKRYHRSSFSKKEQLRKGMRSENDTRTEYEIMEDANYFCIYDSGMKKWVLNLNKK